MLKIRLQGTKSDIRWFQNILQQSEELKLTEFSRTFSNRGTSRFFRAYAEVIRKNNEEEEDENGKNYSDCKSERRMHQNKCDSKSRNWSGRTGL